ncbi:sensor histidine kinase [Blautia sp. Sow4_E7]|uniref:sensor histidine kinase n=1 Tax=Blautia sp. Sow4_E7 TaxID=3438749 RepID=UPI003F9075FE
MTKSSEKRKQIWNPQNRGCFLIFVFLLALCIYAVGCYPAYAALKTRTIYQLYHELENMKLSDLDDDDIDTLNEFQKEKFEVMVTDEDFQKIYISRNAVSRDYIDRFIKNRQEEYTENAKVMQRNLELRHVLILKGKIIDGGHTFYVYIKKDVQSGIDIIKGTTIYFLLIVMLDIFLYYVLSQKGKWETEKQSKQSDYQLLESQREFVANISHELKTPLAVVSSQVEMLEIAGDKIDRTYYYSSIHEELDKMSKMIGELLDFSMLDNQMSAMEMSRVNVSEMVEYLLLRYDAMFRKNEIKIEQNVEKKCFVYGNRMYLERAANNYLMNAFQHTKQGKCIRVTLKKVKKQIRLEVYNDGELIKEDQIERIWDSFYTTSQKKTPVTSENNVRNAGLGLFVVRKIVTKHKGTCGVSNQENGVLFWIQIPELTE